MEKKDIIKTLKLVKDNSPKRNFKQSVEMIVNLKNLDMKKQDNQVNSFTTLPHPTGKKISVCAFTGPELKDAAEKVCDEVVSVDKFDSFKDKKAIKALARKHDFFISQANVMPKVATTFGRVLGPLAKMPNPKLGAVVPPNANLTPLYEKLQKTKKLMSRNFPLVQCGLGYEDLDEGFLIDNIQSAFKAILHELPNEEQNVRNVYLKLTMGPAFVVGEEYKPEDNKKEKAKSSNEEKKKEEKPEPKDEKNEGAD